MELDNGNKSISEKNHNKIKNSIFEQKPFNPNMELVTEIMPHDFKIYDLTFKLIVIGDAGVGKSCLTMRGTKNFFQEIYAPTIGFEFSTLTIKINDKYVRLQIWDTSGQETYHSLISSFYRNSSLAILTYSINNENSFNHLNYWLNEIKTESNPDIIIFLVGNKVDLINDKVISTEIGQKFAKDNQISFFMETSAKTGFNAKNIFIEAAKKLFLENLKFNDFMKSVVSIDCISNDSISIKNKLENDENKKKNKSCC